MAKDKLIQRKRRHRRVRKRISGTSDKPRLTVYRSLNNIYAQIINDEEGNTLISASSLIKEIKENQNHRGNIITAKNVGRIIGERAVKKNITTVVFDKGSFKYHGRIKALADAAREAGLKF